VVEELLKGINRVMKMVEENERRGSMKSRGPGTGQEKTGTCQAKLTCKRKGGD